MSLLRVESILSNNVRKLVAVKLYPEEKIDDRFSVREAAIVIMKRIRLVRNQRSGCGLRPVESPSGAPRPSCRRNWKIIRNCARAHVHDVCNKQKSLPSHNSKEYFQCFVFQLGAQDMTIRWPRQVSPSRWSDVITGIISVIKLTHSTRLVG